MKKIIQTYKIIQKYTTLFNIKPENILIENENVKISDFGYFKQGKEGQIDCFQIASILLIMLTGERPAEDPEDEFNSFMEIIFKAYQQQKVTMPFSYSCIAFLAKLAEKHSDITFDMILQDPFLKIEQDSIGKSNSNFVDYLMQRDYIYQIPQYEEVKEAVLQYHSAYANFHFKTNHNDRKPNIEKKITKIGELQEFIYKQLGLSQKEQK